MGSYGRANVVSPSPRARFSASSAPDARVVEPQGTYRSRFVDVAQVDECPSPHPPSHLCQVETAVGVPLREQHHGVCAVECLVDVVDEFDRLGQVRSRLGDALRIRRPDQRAVLDERGENRERGGLAHVVGLRLERESEYRDDLAGLVPTERAADLGDHPASLAGVDLDHGFDDSAGRSMFLRDSNQGQRILGKARAAESGAGVQELAPDPPVESNAARDRMHVRADGFAQRRHLVDEADLRGEEGVCRILDELRGLEVRDDNRNFDEVQRPVERAQPFLRAVALDADDDAIRAHEVADRGSLAEEFRVRGDVEIRPRIDFRNDARDLPCGADRDGGLVHHHAVSAQERRDPAHRVVHERQVGMTVAAARRCPHGDEDQLRIAHALPEVGGEPQSSLLDIAANEIVETGFVDRHPAFAEPGDLRLVDVDTGHRRAELGKTRSGDEADVARSDHRDLHQPPTPRRREIGP